jgi:serine/threonine-protein kinase
VPGAKRPGPTAREATLDFDGSIEVLAAAPPPPPPPEAYRARPVPAGATAPRTWLVDCGELARGGMSRIQKVYDGNLQRHIAMKVLQPSSLAPELNTPEQAQARFRTEAQITGQLDHPNIPPIHDLWLDPEGHLCFTMKLVEGQTLTEIIGARPLQERTEHDLERLLDIFLKVCDAVSFAHSRGVIHRDLKPDNIMVGSHGQVYVMDWGCALLRPGAAGAPTVAIARDAAARSEAQGLVAGTGAYMAPEQATGQTDRIDERTDVYLLGAVLYEILTQLAPHRGRSALESVQLAQRNEIRPPYEVSGAVRLPPELCRIAMRALATEPSERYPSVGALRAEIDRAVRQGWWFASLTLPRGAVVFRQGDLADAAYIITAGACEAFRVEDGARMVLRRMGPGDSFGESSILTGRRRGAAVEVVEEMTATVVTRESLERALGGDSFVGSFVRALAERFHALEAQLAWYRRAVEQGEPSVPLPPEDSGRA